MNWVLYRSFRCRGLTQAKLAALTGLNRSVLARILTNQPGRGKETRKKLAPYLTVEEWRILGWDLAEWQQNQPQPMEQSSTANIVPSTQAT